MDSWDDEIDEIVELKIKFSVSKPKASVLRKRFAIAQKPNLLSDF